MTISEPVRAESARDKPQDAVSIVADRIRDDAIALDEGALLGSEDTLLARYGVSRPTLREALSVLTREQLISVKRGVGGGYFARRPDSHAVSRMAALYLKSHRSEFGEAVAAFLPVRIEAAQFAARSTNQALRAELQLLRDRDAQAPELDLRSFVASERQMLDLLARLSENQVLNLFLAIVLDLSWIQFRIDSIYGSAPGRVTIMRRERGRMIDAILDGDVELTGVFARRCARMLLTWLAEDGHETRLRPSDIPG